MGHVRDLPDDLFGSHEGSLEEGDDCYGTMCETCGCCMHCSEGGCECDSPACGCREPDA
jgi:hypothetical protein